MRVSRSEPGVVISSAAHAGLLLAALVLFSDTKKFDDAQEMIPIEVVTGDALNQVAKGEKSARDLKPSQRVDKVAPQSETKPEPPLAEAKKDTPTPPPPLKRQPDPGADDRPEPVPPKRVAALPPAPEPPTRPQPEKKPEPPKPVEAKPAPTPPAKPKAAAPEEKEQDEPKEAEVVKPKPPVRPKPEKVKETEAKETPKPEKPKERLKPDEVAKLLDSKKAEEKPAKPENSEGETAEKSIKGAKPKSGDESAPKSKFDAASISKLLSKEAPQRRAATGDQLRTASLGAPEGSAPKMSATMEARIAAYIHDHYHPCWASALTLGGQTFAPVVEFHLSREGQLEGRPRLLNPSGNPVEQARGEQAVQAVRRCSPMRIPPEFMPYYEEALHDVTIRFQDAN
ncbi:cell envelope biogenesis protein TolA [Methylocystis sp. IM3]|uniref:cell envelope biogenesis protein TolA n=1 Tax=unclassified Methylocystis TaxID=2625913 RepID=UPI0030F9C4AD